MWHLKYQLNIRTYRISDPEFLLMHEMGVKRVANASRNKRGRQLT
jgi:hypothetical protein